MFANILFVLAVRESEGGQTGVLTQNHQDTNELKTDIKYTGTQLLKKKHDTKHAVSEISWRISVLSSNKEIFNNANNEEAIKEAGHKEKFSCINQEFSRVEASQNPVFNPPWTPL